MKLTASAGDLRNALRLCERVSERKRKKSRVPILSCVKVAVTKDGTSITANNLDLAIRVSLPCTGRSVGETCVSVRSLTALISAMPRDTSVILSKSGDAELTVGTTFGNYTMPTLPAADFPLSIELSNAEEIVFADDATLRSALAMALPFASKEHTRYYLNGVCLDFNEDIPLAVATDGHRLCSLPAASVSKPKEKAIILPTKAAELLRDIPVGSLFVEGAKFRASFAGGELSGKLIDGTFPDWRRVIPANCTATLSISGAQILPPLARLAAMLGSNRREAMVTMAFAADGRALIAHFGREMQGHEFFVFTPGKMKEPITFSVNRILFRDLLKSIGPETEVRFSAPNDPLTFIAGDVRQILMPMRGDDSKKALTLLADASGLREAA